MIDGERSIDSGKIFDLPALARIHEKRGALDLARAVSINLAKHRNQGDRQVVDAVIAQVFECIQDRPFARAGETSENYELPGVS